MKKRLLYILLSGFIFFTLDASGQKNITILGSSTAAGGGASPDSGWVDRLRASFNKNLSDGLDTFIDNRAYPGYVTYQGMPDDYVSPPNRTGWPADPFRNVTYVINHPPNIVILSYPSNDVFLFNPSTGQYDYNMQETMDNLRLMKQRFTIAGILCYITTTQPRNDASDVQRGYLHSLRDSILNNFGFFAINFWDDLATTDGLNNLKPEVNSGDGVHPNNLGHRLLFQRVQSKNIFNPPAGSSLPLSLTSFEGQLQNDVVVLKWHTEKEDPNSDFEIQRSSDGRVFQTIGSKNAIGTGISANYSWTDIHPLKGKNYYRLKINEPQKTSYSKILGLTNKIGQSVISGLYADNSSLHFEIQSPNVQKLEFSIATLSGGIVRKQIVSLTAQTNSISIPVSNLSAGEYILFALMPDGTREVQRFVKLK